MEGQCKKTAYVWCTAPGGAPSAESIRYRAAVPPELPGATPRSEARGRNIAFLRGYIEFHLQTFIGFGVMDVVSRTSIIGLNMKKMVCLSYESRPATAVVDANSRGSLPVLDDSSNKLRR